MINSIEDLRSGGVLPTGPVSAWPKERNVSGRMKQQGKLQPGRGTPPSVKADKKQMAHGLARSAAQAFVNGRVSPVIRKERYDTCQACPSFIEDSKRCAECGCWMEAKSWIGGNPDKLCPLKKWSR